MEICNASTEQLQYAQFLALTGCRIVQSLKPDSQRERFMQGSRRIQALGLVLILACGTIAAPASAQADDPKQPSVENHTCIFGELVNWISAGLTSMPMTRRAVSYTHLRAHET